MRKKIANTAEFIATDLRLLFMAKQKIHPAAARVKSESDHGNKSKDKREEERKERDISDIVIS